jgi:hypothetical protein
MKRYVLWNKKRGFFVECVECFGSFKSRYSRILEKAFIFHSRDEAMSSLEEDDKAVLVELTIRLAD